MLLFLAGCNGTLPPAPKETLIPVAVPCLERMPEAPKFLSDAELTQLDDFHFVIELRRDQLELRGHLAILTAALQPCVKLP